ncbi:MAG: type IV pilus twitching motility protein PilT [Ethanoligenens sp.]
MIEIDDLLRKTMQLGASDLHISVAVPPMVRVNGQLNSMDGYKPLSPAETQELCYSMLKPERAETLQNNGQVDFSYVINGEGRFRVNVFKQRRSYSAAIRVLVQEMPSIDGLGLPSILKELVLRPRGLILVTGPTGSGKSTSLAALVDYINSNRRCHVLTIEDPIEYLHKHHNSIINQREIGDDAPNFSMALRAALREDPDVILVGEMRDLETISTALSAAETGHLVLSTLHTNSAPQTVDRIIDMFPANQQQQIQVQLAASLQAVMTQQLLINKMHNGRVVALGLMLVSDAIRNMIREGKTHQIATAMQTGIRLGNRPMDYALSQLVKENKIDQEEGLARCLDPDTFRRYLSL